MTRSSGYSLSHGQSCGVHEIRSPCRMGSEVRLSGVSFSRRDLERRPEHALPPPTFGIIVEKTCSCGPGLVVLHQFGTMKLCVASEVFGEKIRTCPPFAPCASRVSPGDRSNVVVKTAGACITTYCAYFEYLIDHCDFIHTNTHTPHDDLHNTNRPA